MPTSEMLARLVSFDTTSRNANLELIGFVRNWLDMHNVPYRISFDPTENKANLHAIIGRHAEGGIALSGHVDTVPVDGQAWSSDPFTLRRDGGKLYARGAADMKGFVAACLAAVPALVARQLARPLHLFITFDEETDMAGARRLIEDITESGLRPSLCIVGEPSLMQPILAHKGRLAACVTATGRAGHSSVPAQGVNAVYAAAEAIAWIAGEARRIEKEGPFEDGFDPPHTTVHVGTVEGGTALNIIPTHASFSVECRPIPGDDSHALLARLRDHIANRIEPWMKSVDPACGLDISVMNEVPGMSLGADHPLATLMKQLTGSNSTGKVSYATEGGLYEEAGIATIICGPGSIAQAHQADEWVAQSQLDACDAFIARLADRLAAGGVT